MDRKIIAVCASWEDVENLNLVLSYLIEAAGERGYLPMCVCFDRDSLEARGAQSLGEFLSAFDVPGLAGFLLFGEMIRSDIINTRLIELARKKALPVFMLEREYEGCVNMALSYGKGFEAVARHLVKDHGCRDVVMVAGLRDNPYSEERIRLCRQVLEENGSALPPERVIYGDFWDEPTMRALDGYFAGGGQMPEAFICANDAMAIAVCIYLAERDIQVPGQVRVSGFDGIVQGENHDPTITTAKPDYLGMFERMLDRVSAWKAEEAGGTEVWPIPFELKCRESCGCAGRNAFESTKRISSLKDLNLAYARHIRTMGGFIRRILNKNTLDGLAECLPPLFSLWQRPYDFAAILAEQESGAALPILHGVHSRYTSDGVFQWRGTLLTDFDALRADASVRIVVAQLLQNKEETLGYLVSGMGEWNQWEQECFEEQAIFLAAALHAVVSNHRLEKANRAITRMAEHDYLTGLYNRRGFLRELERRLRLKES